MKKTLILIITIAVALSSCEDKLEKSPLVNVSDASFWNSPADFKLAANKLYTTLPGQLEDWNSDIAFATGDNSVSSGTNVSTENDNNWKNNYTNIRTASNIIAKAEEKTDIDAKRYVAEARFFRAYYYFNLVKRFGDVPLIKDYLSVDSEQVYSGRTARSEVVDFIINELTLAANDLPKRSEMSAADLGRITKGAANSLKARVALFEGCWTKYNSGGDGSGRFQTAVDAAKAVIDSDEFALFKDHGDESYRYLFLDEGDDNNKGKKPESVLHRRYWEEVATHGFSNSHQAKHNATRKIIDMYLCNDGLPIDKSPLFNGYDTYTSEFDNRDPRLINSIVKVGDEVWTHSGPSITEANFTLFYWARTGYRIWKRQGEGLPRTLYKEFNDHHIIRYAEVLLTYTEALYELNGSISDEDLNISVNVVRDRVDMPHLTNQFVTDNSLNMLNELRRERTIELAFEGFRFDDLRRWGVAVEELSKPLLGFKFTGSQWGDLKDSNGKTLLQKVANDGLSTDGFVVFQDKSTRLFSDKNYLFPLPLKEMQLNSNLKPQNPGWE